MVNHGSMSHCYKDCVNMKINHGQHAYFRVCNIYLRVYIPLVYNINPLGFNIIRLGS